MQHIEALPPVRPKMPEAATSYPNRGRFYSFLATTFLSFFGSQASSEAINTLAANADCDVVSIQQAARSQRNEDPEKVDWLAFDRKQREYTGKELLPEHQIKEPEQDTVTGCAIKDEGETAAGTSEDDGTEMVHFEREGEAERSSNSDAASPEETEGTGAKPSEISKEPEQSLIDLVMSANGNLFIRILVILSMAATLIGASFGLNYLSKIALGLIRRRRVCMIPVSVMTEGKEIPGHITILGLNCSRFVPTGKDECAYLDKLLKDREPHYFDLIVGDLSVAVFLDGMRGFFTPCAFDKRLSVKLQKAMLQHSTVEPQIGQLIAVPHDIPRHKAYIKARAALKKKTGNANLAMA